LGVGQGVSPDLWADGQEQLIEVAGFQRLRLRPFDPSRDTLTEHEQTDARLLAMFGQLDAPEFDTEDVRAFCRLFAGFVRAAQVIMFEKTFMRGSRVSEAEFHNELERLLGEDPELQGRLTRRGAGRSLWYSNLPDLSPIAGSWLPFGVRLRQ
jgi:hypothetical protein